jgi:hypothetical protein
MTGGNSNQPANRRRVFLAFDFEQVVLDVMTPELEPWPMKMILVALGFGTLLVFLSIHPAIASPTRTNLPPCRLTVELRDGSRVIGQSDSETIKFRSTLLGNLKLAVKDIRSVECSTTNAAKLTTASGDTLTVTFAATSLNLLTSFGKIELAVDSIRRLAISSGNSSPAARWPGLVALWSGEDNGKDSVGNNDAELTDICFADGKLERAFSFNQTSADIKISASPVLDVGKGAGFTLAVWINPANISIISPIFEWSNEGPTGCVHFFIYPPHGGPGTLYANITDTEGASHYFSASGVLIAGVFQHVALTYEKISGRAKLFCNGTVVAEENLGSFTPETSHNLHLGRRPPSSGEDFVFAGLMDETAIYDRALSDFEINELCIKDNHGEPLPAPSRTFQRNNFF